MNFRELGFEEGKSKILNELFTTKTEGHIVLEYMINLRF
jgi:hypothetical protein